MAQFEQWSGFNGRLWKEEVNVRDFIQNNYTPYEGDESFLVGHLQRQLTNYGESFRNCRKKSVQKAAFWIWRQK